VHETGCACCEESRVLLADAHRRIEALQAETATLQTQLREIAKSEALLRKDVERLTDLYAHTRPNCPERTPRDEAQLAFERVVETFGDTAANDAAKDDTADAGTSSQEPLAGAPNTKPETKEPKIKRRHRHGRRRLDLTRLPVEHVAIDPPEVAAAGGEGFVRIGEEVSDRLAFRPASYFRLRLVRGKWARRAAMETNAAIATAVAHASPHDVPCEGADAAPVSVDVPTPVLVAPLPEGVWPTVMADPSAVAQIVIAKYDDITPLHRQERISVRQGFALPRSTQCGWLAIAYLLLYRIVDAMLEDACATARCIAMDATGAPVRTKGGSVKRHVFVLIADRDHIVFRFAKEHSGQTVRAFLEGFHGEFLADAAPIYDVLYRDEGMTEIACWFHCRRYFWRALETDRAQALEALAMIAQLFTIDAACKDIEMPCRTRSARPRAPDRSSRCSMRGSMRTVIGSIRVGRSARRSATTTISAMPYVASSTTAGVHWTTACRSARCAISSSDVTTGDHSPTRQACVGTRRSVRSSRRVRCTASTHKTTSSSSCASRPTGLSRACSSSRRSRGPPRSLGSTRAGARSSRGLGETPDTVTEVAATIAHAA
jgi:transposase